MSNFDSEHTESVVFIDVGNSSIKMAFRRDGGWVVHRYESAPEAASAINNHPYPITKIYVSSVLEGVKDLLESEIQAHLVEEITIDKVNPETLAYETPETLGIDRYFACIGAKQRSEYAVVVIDAGSACTIDYINEQGVYQGGVIMPGLRSILDIFEYTAPELPEIEIQLPDHFPGKNTKESLQWGQVGLFVSGIKSMLKRYKSTFGSFDIYLTGGDAEVVNELLDNVAMVEKNLVFEGMALSVTSKQ